MLNLNLWRRDWIIELFLVISLQIPKARNIKLRGNVVAGSEMIGFRISGEACAKDSSTAHAWGNNVAHSGLHGIHIFKDDGLPGCSRIANFTAYRNYDYGEFSFYKNTFM